MRPDFQEENKLWKRGFKRVAGLDEAGRGPLAGPVVAAAVAVLDNKYKIPYAVGLKDSKQLSQKQREEFYQLFVKDKKIGWGIGIVSEKIIDKINILEATKLAMLIALRKLEKKKIKVDFLILDGKMRISSPVPQKSIIKGDEKVFSCAAASVLAKVTRDRLMEKYHRVYPRYKFNLHKGYPTKLHFQLLKKYGPCKIHRLSFAPVKQALRH